MIMILAVIAMLAAAEGLGADSVPKKALGRTIYAGPSYEDLGAHEIVINRLIIRNMDPSTPIRMKYLLFRNQDRELVDLRDGQFFSENRAYSEMQDIVVAPSSSLNFGNPEDSKPIYIYRGDPQKGRPMFIVGWEAEKAVVRPQVGAVVSAYKVGQDRDRTLLTLWARWKEDE
jgi:hypothetical protein